MGYAFICYSSKSQQMADSFRTLLTQNGIKTWLAPGDVPAISAFASTINSTIKGSSCFVLLHSLSEQDSPWVLDATERAKKAGKKIINVLLDDMPMSDDNIRTLIILIKSYTGEEKKAEKKPQETEAEIYFRENAVMHGSVLEHFTGRTSADVVIPEGVTEIATRAFAFYSKLKSITIPSTVKKIGSYPFLICPNLQSITIPPENSVFRSEGNCCIERATDRVVFGCSESVIPYGVKAIGQNAFNGCEKLTAINIPSSVISIETEAFFDCKNLKELALEEGVKEIGTLAFCDCCSLEKLSIPSSTAKISDDAFYNCKTLKSITVAHGNTVYHSEGNCLIETATNTLVLGCQNSIIPTTITIIGAGAFSGCTELIKISIPDSVKEIGNAAFLGCKGLKSIKIPVGVTKIGTGAFSECSNIENVYISKNVCEIGDRAFRDCPKLNSIIVAPENSVYYSKDNCCIRKEDNVLIFGCRSSIIPNEIIGIGAFAFCGCKWLTGISIPTSVERIGAFAFSECNNLISIIIPDSVMYIGEYAFAMSDCTEESHVIFCEATDEPDDWDVEWTDDISEVYWKDEWFYDEDGIPTVKD